MAIKKLLAAALISTMGFVATAEAHPAPFSYLDVRIQANVVDVSIVAHAFDLAHDLGVAPVERLLDQAFLETQRAAIFTVLGPRLSLTVDRHALRGPEWSNTVEVMPERQSVLLRARFSADQPFGVVA